MSIYVKKRILDTETLIDSCHWESVDAEVYDMIRTDIFYSIDDVEDRTMLEDVLQDAVCVRKYPEDVIERVVDLITQLLERKYVTT